MKMSVQNFERHLSDLNMTEGTKFDKTNQVLDKRRYCRSIHTILELVMIILVIHIGVLVTYASAEELLRNTYRSSDNYYDRYLLDSPYNLCRDPLMRKGHLSSTSSAHQRGPDEAYLWGGSAWTAENSDFQQALIIDLGSIKNVTGIATQGRQHSDEYVMEYIIQYGTNGKDFSDYKEVDGAPKLFRGNEDGDYVTRNDFEQPIIAQWIRINPTRWADRISLRMELYGCKYIADVLYFNGKAMIQKDIARYPVASIRDTIRLRFKTNSENGVLLYSRGSQGDYIALQLVENRLLLNINLGHVPGKSHTDLETSMALGSLLDDNIFHEVYLSRERRDVILSVDRVKIRDRIKGDFVKLNLDRQIYIGGAPHVEEGLVVFENFTGCIENMYLNHSNVIASFTKPFYSSELTPYEDTGINQVAQSCPIDHFTVPVTFKNAQSFVKLPGLEGSYSMNVRLEFRTYEENGLLFFHAFSSDGSVMLKLEDGRLKVILLCGQCGVPKVELDNFDNTWNDGKWHSVEFVLGRDYAQTTIDNEPMETQRKLDISTGPYYWFGGGLHGEAGYIGCMRNITINGNYKIPSDWSEEEMSDRKDIQLESCEAVDRCSPNPCEHGGICKQNSQEFYCECEDTGYTGAVCHTSLNFYSCVHYLAAHPESQVAETTIDIDGSGPLAPFDVKCEFFPDGRNITYVRHKNEAPTKVDGFQDHGSYAQEIFYETTVDNMEALINRSKACIQRLGYDCKSSSLLNSGGIRDILKFNPAGWWVSRQNKKMDYWAGSLPGSMKCECGITGTCIDQEKWCNCDSLHDDWLFDGGEIAEKEYLPVKALHFGDTGTPLDKKEGRYTLGPLECDGDTLFDNVVTFRRDDAAIKLPPFDIGQVRIDLTVIQQTWIAQNVFIDR